MKSGKLPVVMITAETGFIIRNLLLGNFIQELREKAKVLIAVNKPEDPELKRLLDHPNVELVQYRRMEFPVVHATFPRLKFLQYWMFYVILAHKPTKSLKNFARIYDKAHSWKLKALQKGVYATGWMINNLGLRRAFERYYLKHYAKFEITKYWEDMLKKHEVDIVMSTMLSHSLKYTPSNDLPFVLAAHKLGIKITTLIQSWDNISSKPTVYPLWLDKYFTWSDTQTKELLELYPWLDPARIQAIGSPQFDFHVMDSIMVPREEFARELGIDPSRPYILIGTGIAVHIPDEITKAMKIIRRYHEINPEMQYVLRMHPKDYSNRVDEFLSEFKKYGIVVQRSNPKVHMDEGGFTPPKEFYRDQVNALRHSVLVLNSSSTITVDASIVDKPVICLAYDLDVDDYKKSASYKYAHSDHYSRLANSGGVWLVCSEDECIDAIQQYVSNPAMHKPERRKLAEMVTISPDGNAGRRLADAVMETALRN